MPQTSPMSWLMIIITISFIAMSIKSSISIKMNKPSKKNLTIKNMNWKW